MYFVNVYVPNIIVEGMLDTNINPGGSKHEPDMHYDLVRRAGAFSTATRA